MRIGLLAVCLGAALCGAAARAGGVVPPNGALRYCIHYRSVSPDFLEFLRRAKVNFLHWHGPFYGYRGFPERAKLEGMKASTRATLEQVHAAGAACILYIGPCFSYGDRSERTILFDFVDKRWKDYEDYFGPRPADLLEMAQRDRSGAPRPYVYRGQKGYHLCVNSPAVRAYCKGLIRLICESGGDGSFYDGPYVRKGSCYCRHCRERFRRWLREAYSKRELADHFGVADPGHVDPPTDAKSRLWLPWRKFAAWSLWDFLRETKAYARSLNPRYVMTANYCMWSGEPFGPLRGSAESMELWSQVLDIVFDEAKYGAGPRTAKGVKLSNGTDYRYLLAASHGKPVALLKTAPDGETPEAQANLTRLAIAEGAAQGATWQFHYLKGPALEAAVEYNAFLAKRADVMTRARPWSPIAAWASLQQGYLGLPTYPMAVSRFLADRHVPHKLLIDEDVEHGRLGGCEVVIVPEVHMISEAQMASLLRFAQGGGSLVLMGECGTVDEWGKARPRSPLMPAAGGWPKEPGFRKLGRGQAAYLPRVSLSASPNLGLSAGQETALAPLLDVVERATDAGLPARVEAGPSVEVALCYDGDATMLVHLVNYAVDLSGQVEPAANVPVEVRLPQGKTVEAASIFSPDQPTKGGPVKCEILARGPSRYAAFVIPGLHIYTQVELRLKPTPARSQALPRGRIVFGE